MADSYFCALNQKPKTWCRPGTRFAAFCASGLGSCRREASGRGLGAGMLIALKCGPLIKALTLFLLLCVGFKV